ncbi:amino acid transporter AVT6A [Ricinus communis]|uniref:Amino acid transporter, putative n=1 Tax=Ricinus communis TaxID=3988 RepID=B9RLF1_RICCO|nr:amino acid transporter AVT6A [Ricinus communis]EEF47676.1 amino acid transporter, putative [Ricinus communis]|eukprot:XP_002514570.1 amino acid transporter AVT6A [Ricinus communis]
MKLDKKKMKKTTRETHNQESPLLPKTRADGQEAKDFNGASFLGAVFNLSTTIIGAGIMALPAIMKVLGVGLGIGMIVLVAILTEYSLEILLRYSKAAKVESYGGVMGDAFGNIGKRLLQIFILLNIVGVLIVYIIIIGDVLSGTSSNGVHHAGVLEGWFGSHWWNGRTFVLLFITLSVFAPLSCFKRIDSLRYTSALAFALAVVFLIITAGITIFKLVNGSVAMPRFVPNVSDIASFWNLFTVVPILVTAFICHVNIHTIENELEDSSLIQPVMRTSISLCSTVYILTSFFGILLFGNSTLDDVLANFDTNLGVPYSYVLNDVIRISYALHLILVFPVVFHPLRLNLDGLLFPSARPLVLDNCRFTLISITLISLIFLGANFISSIWIAFQFTGATSSIVIGFIFPAAIALRDPHLVASKKDKVLSVFMIFLALFSSLVAIYSDAYALFRKNPSPHE